MIKLYSTYKVVKEILTTKPETRNRDALLYIEVARHVQETHGTDILHKPFGLVLMNLQAYDLPTFETVRRARQKLQNEYKELMSDTDVAAQREVNEEEYRQFATATIL